MYISMIYHQHPARFFTLRYGALVNQDERGVNRSPLVMLGAVAVGVGVAVAVGVGVAVAVFVAGMGVLVAVAFVFGVAVGVD